MPSPNPVKMCSTHLPFPLPIASAPLLHWSPTRQGTFMAQQLGAALMEMVASLSFRPPIAVGSRPSSITSAALADGGLHPHSYLTSLAICMELPREGECTMPG